MVRPANELKNHLLNKYILLALAKIAVNKLNCMDNVKIINNSKNMRAEYCSQNLTMLAEYCDYLDDFSSLTIKK